MTKVLLPLIGPVVSFRLEGIVCGHHTVNHHTKVHDRATMDKRVGSTGKTYTYSWWACGVCSVPFYPHQKNHQFQGSQTDVDREINELR